MAEKRFSSNRFEGVMAHSNTTWKELCDQFGSNFRNLVYTGHVPESTLYDACMYMGVDYRYVLMLRDDYEFSYKDPVLDPRTVNAQPKNVITKAGASSEQSSPAVQKSIENKKDGKPENDKKDKKKIAVKNKKAFLYREDNRMIPERVAEMQRRSGLSFTVFSMLLGVKYPTLTEFLQLRTFQEGTTSSVAWILKTTPDYLTGKSQDPFYGNDKTIRYVLDSQTFLLDSCIIWEYKDKIQKNLGLTDQLAEWIVSGNRLVTEELAERIAKTIGLHISRIRAKGSHYKTEPSIAHILDGKKETQNRPTDDLQSQNKTQNSESKQQASVSKVPKIPTPKAKDAKPDPSNTADKETAQKNTDSSIFPVIDAMSDEDLDSLIEYVDMLKKMRSFRAKIG